MTDAGHRPCIASQTRQHCANASQVCGYRSVHRSSKIDDCKITSQQTCHHCQKVKRRNGCEPLTSKARTQSSGEKTRKHCNPMPSGGAAHAAGALQYAAMYVSRRCIPRRGLLRNGGFYDHQALVHLIKHAHLEQRRTTVRGIGPARTAASCPLAPQIAKPLVHTALRLSRGGHKQHVSC